MSAKSESAAAARPVWSHAAGEHAEAAVLAVAYCAGRDVTTKPMADARLVPWDVWTNLAHCAMLRRQGIIDGATLAAIAGALEKIEARWTAGDFALDPALEDVHINIERAVAGIAGEAPAGAMHTARSRNDQTATDIRLWLRDSILTVHCEIKEAVEALAEFARRHTRTVMAGWTHGQPAMPTTLGHWACGYAQALARDARALRDLWPMLNVSPLGAAAGFGTGWDIDRKLTAEWLGFDAPQANSLDCVSTRWEMESRVGSILAIMMNHLSCLGQDLIFLSSPPRRLIELNAAFTTGSSIMPQKRNPDFAEVTRARAASAQGLLLSTLNAGRGALSGYNRDTQWTKYWIMDLMDEVGAAPRVFALAIASIKVDAAGLARTAAAEFVTAVDLADAIASGRKVEFRRAYHVVGRSVAEDLAEGRFRLETVNRFMAEADIHPPLTPAELKHATDPELAINARKSLGGPHPDETLRIADDLIEEARAGGRWAESTTKHLEHAKKKLREAIHGGK